MRKGVVIGGAILLAAAGAAAWFGPGAYQTARIGTAYVAKQTCSCRFVAGRTPQSCSTDYDPATVAQLSVAAGTDRVKVSALGGIVAATAQFEAGYGCHLVD